MCVSLFFTDPNDVLIPVCSSLCVGLCLVLCCLCVSACLPSPSLFAGAPLFVAMDYSVTVPDSMMFFCMLYILLHLPCALNYIKFFYCSAFSVSISHVGSHLQMREGERGLVCVGSRFGSH